MLRLEHARTWSTPSITCGHVSLDVRVPVWGEGKGGISVEGTVQTAKPNIRTITTAAQLLYVCIACTEGAEDGRQSATLLYLSPCLTQLNISFA